MTQNMIQDAFQQWKLLGDSLEEFLSKATPDKGLIRLMMCMGEALRTIAFEVRTASCGGTACVNTFGDEQLAVNVLADKLLFEVIIRANFTVKIIRYLMVMFVELAGSVAVVCVVFLLANVV